MRTKVRRFVLMGLLGVATALGAAAGAQADDRYHGHSGHGHYSQGYGYHGNHGYHGHGPYRSYGHRYYRPYYGGYGYYPAYGYGYGGYGYAPPAYVPYRPNCGPRVSLHLGFGF
jgi:hypothetical protein